MPLSYNTIQAPASAEVVVKKSKFIANAFPAETEEQAAAKIEEVKKKYYDARHNCYAYQVGKACSHIRCSDDGEPQGTAGIPILDALKGRAITNTVVIVTRYFGGILLGTGGLVHAYSAAAKAALEQAGIVTRVKYIKVTITMDYQLHGKINYLLLSNNHIIEDTVFTDTVTIKAGCLFNSLNKLLADVTEISQGKAQTQVGEPYYL